MDYQELISEVLRRGKFALGLSGKLADYISELAVKYRASGSEMALVDLKGNGCYGVAGI